MASKTAIIDKSKSDFLLVDDEIRYSHTGYCLIYDSPVSLRASVFEACIYKLQKAKAHTIMLGLRESHTLIPDQMNFGPLRVSYRYAMMVMSRSLAQSTSYARRVRLERLTPERVDEYWTLHNLIFTGVDNASFSRRGDIISCMRKANYEIMFAYDGDEVVGICEYELLNPKNALLDSIGVKKDLRGSGYGKDILRNVCYALKSQGARSLELIVGTSNDSAVKLYRSEGFRKKSIMSRWYEYLGPQDGVQ